jgi:hypothetical protein
MSNEDQAKTENKAPASTAIATIPHRVSSAIDVFSDPAAFEHAQRVARVFSESAMVPKHLQGKLADCLIAYQIAKRLNEEPLTVMQNIYVVNGTPGWKAQYMIARAVRSGVFASRIVWRQEGEGPTLKVTASTTLADTGEMIEAFCDMKMATAEGWTRNAKYTSMPEHMLKWRSATMLIRLYAPEVMLGMPVIEELETLPPMRDVTPPDMSKSLDDFANNTAEENAAHSAVEDKETPAAGTSGDSSAGKAGPPAAARPPAPSEATAPPAGGTAPTAAAEAPKEPEKKEKPAATEGVEVKNEAQYADYCRGWIAAMTEPDTSKAKWKGEKSLRNKANVSPEVRIDLEKLLDAKNLELAKDS